MTNGSVDASAQTKILCRWCQQTEVNEDQQFCEECSTFLNNISERDTTQADIKIDELLDQLQKTRDPSEIEAIKERIKKLHLSKDQELDERAQQAKGHHDVSQFPSEQQRQAQQSSSQDSKSS